MGICALLRDSMQPVTVSINVAPNPAKITIHTDTTDPDGYIAKTTYLVSDEYG